MPIVFTKKDGWTISKPTKEEQEAITEIGKKMIVEGLAGSYTSERYKKWLLTHDVEEFFKV